MTCASGLLGWKLVCTASIAQVALVRSIIQMANLIWRLLAGLSLDLIDLARPWDETILSSCS